MAAVGEAAERDGQRSDTFPNEVTLRMPLPMRICAVPPCPPCPPLSALSACREKAKAATRVRRRLPHSATSRPRSGSVPGFPGPRRTAAWATGSTACCGSGPTPSSCRAGTTSPRKGHASASKLHRAIQPGPRKSDSCCWRTGTVVRSRTVPRSRDSTKAVLGANDGGSGVALLLGVADVLKRTPPAIGVDLLFVDGEDYGDFTETPTDVLIGSRYYGAHQLPGPKPLYAVLFDLVADKDLQLYQEGNSLVGAPEVVELVWETAKDLGYWRLLRGLAPSHADRRSPRAAEGRHPRDRRRRLRLSRLAHHRRHDRQGERRQSCRSSAMWRVALVQTGSRREVRCHSERA